MVGHVSAMMLLFRLLGPSTDAYYRTINGMNMSSISKSGRPRV